MKASLIFLFPFTALILSSCSSLRPETTANGAEARANCIALKEHFEGVENRLSSRNVSTADDSEELVAIELTLIESKRGKEGEPRNPVEVLSKAEGEKRIEELKSEGKRVSYPRMITESGSPVTFRSVVKQPFVRTAATEVQDAGGSTTVTLDYVPLGKLFGLNSTRLAGGNFLLDLDLTVSDSAGTERLDGADYPVVSSSVYSGSHEISDGGSVILELEPADGDDPPRVFLVASVSSTPKNPE